MIRWIFTPVTLFLTIATFQSRMVVAADGIIRHSDIDMVSWYPPGQHTLDPEVFRKWGVTLVTWGLDSIFAETANVPQPLSEVVKAAHDGGVRDYLANLDMCSAQPWNLARDAKLREAIGRDFNGEGLVVPWFPAVVDGVPAYAGCINHPVYRENVRQRVRAGHDAGCKGLHVDCANALTGILGRHGGCYCEYCMEGFRKYLREKYSARELSEAGVDDIDTWDFAAEVRRVAGTKERLLEMLRRGQIDSRIPLFRDYRRFLMQASVAWLKELARLARELGGPDAGVSINGGQVDRWLALHSVADFFTCEVRHNPETKDIPVRVIGQYRAAESLDRMLSVTAGTVTDWHYPAKGGMDRLVAMWVAFAYANGHLFIVPNNVWCYSDERGEHAYEAPEEVIFPLYQFIRRNERLLDGYNPVARIGVVYRPGGSIERKTRSGGTTRQWVDPFSEICGELAEANCPFRVLFPGRIAKGRGQIEPGRERLERVVISEGVRLSAEEKKIVENWKRDGRAVSWTEPEAALRGVQPLICVDPDSRIWVFPRKNEDNTAAPVVCHLFNPNYDANRDMMIEQTDIVIDIRSDLAGRSPRKALLYTPYEPPREVPMRPAGDRFEIKIPKLTLWGILSLE